MMERKVRDVINLTPLLDVILILLFAFMIRVDVQQNTEMRQLTDELEHKSARIEELETEAGRLAEEGQAAGQAMAEVRREFEDFQANSAQREKELTAQVERLETERNILTTQLQESQETARDRAEDLAGVRREYEELGREAARLQQDLTAAREKTQQVSQAAARHEQELTDALNRTRRQVEILSSRLKESEEAVKAGARELAAVRGELENLVQTAEQRESELTAALRQARRQVTVLTERLQESEQAVQAGTQTLAVVRSELENFRQFTEQREKELSAALTKAEELEATLAAELGEVRTRLVAVERDLASQTVLLETAKGRRLEVESALEAVREERDRLAAQIVQLAEEVQGLSRTLSQDRQEAAANQERNAARIKELSAAWSEAVKQRDELDRQLKLAQIRLESRDREIEVLAAQKTISAEEIARELAAITDQAMPGMSLHINFEFDSAKLTETGRQQADQLGQALLNPAFKDRTFTLIGHTDQQGTEEYNQDLSERRAQAVRQYLLDHFDIAPEHLKAEGRGESEIIYPGDTALDHALNRRVEVR